MQTPPGWYRDPTNDALERWWDGASWTNSARSVPPALPSGVVGSSGAGSRTRNLAALTGVLVVLVAMVVSIAVLRDGGSTPVFDGTGGSRAPSPVPAAGRDFVESNGTYSIRVGDDWERADFAAGAAWYTGTGSRSFRDNVNVIVEDLPGRLGLDDYVELSIANAGRNGLVLDDVHRDRVVLSDGREAVVIEFASTQKGFALRHRLVVTLRDRVAVNATFTSERDRFDAAVLDVDAYLRTISVR